MELQEKCDELSNMIETLENLLDDLDIKYMDNYISELMFTIDEAKREREEIETRLREIRDEEESIEENEYWRAVV